MCILFVQGVYTLLKVVSLIFDKNWIEQSVGVWGELDPVLFLIFRILQSLSVIAILRI